MNVLLVHAHEEPKSFNGALRDTALKTLAEMGHTVEQSDLYAMNWDPVGGKRDFTKLSEPDYFKYGVEQTKATELGTFAPDVAREQQKLLKADLLIFQFPLWWFGLPAILKGWVDRVFAAGLTYGGGRWYSNGVFKGKRAMLSLTTGGPPNLYNPRGLNGDLDMILYPIQHGMLYFVGFDVLPPFVAFGVSRIGQDQRELQLEAYAERLRNWQHSFPLDFPPLDQYDSSFQLILDEDEEEELA